MLQDCKSYAHAFILSCSLTAWRLGALRLEEARRQSSSLMRGTTCNGEFAGRHDGTCRMAFMEANLQGPTLVTCGQHEDAWEALGHSVMMPCNLQHCTCFATTQDSGTSAVGDCYGHCTSNVACILPYGITSSINIDAIRSRQKSCTTTHPCFESVDLSEIEQVSRRDESASAASTGTALPIGASSSFSGSGPRP